MKKSMTRLIIGGLVAVSAVVVTLNTGIVNAGGKIIGPQPPTVQGATQNRQMGSMDPQMMNSPEMQKQCQDMLKDPEMQKGMKEMLKQPEMQAMMKQMLADDPEMRRTMSDFIAAAEAGAQSGDQTSPDNGYPSAPATEDHNAHHAS